MFYYTVEVSEPRKSMRKKGSSTKKLLFFSIPKFNNYNLTLFLPIDVVNRRLAEILNLAFFSS